MRIEYGRKHIVTGCCVLLAVLSACAATPSSQEPADRSLSDGAGRNPGSTSLVLTEQTFAAWRDHISPTAAELRWTQIPWLTTFGDGIAQADSQDKPLLLWVMNGHPLGCT